MPESGWKSITIREDVFREIQNFVEKNQKPLEAIGIPNLSALVMRALLEFIKKPIPKPRFEHFNVYEDRITIRDNDEGRLVDVYIREKNLWCEYDKSNDCVHVGYAWALPQVRSALRSPFPTLS